MKLIVLLTLLSTGTITLAQNVQYNYDRDANFAAYKSYQWVERERRIADQLVDKDIRRAIDDQMARKGMLKVESNGDLYIRYQTAVDREKQLDAWTMGPRCQVWPAPTLRPLRSERW